MRVAILETVKTQGGFEQEFDRLIIDELKKEGHEPVLYLPENSSYQYHVYVSSDNGYNCYSEPFTVTRHQHSWTYTASGATITASCTDTTCTSPNGGSVTIKACSGKTFEICDSGQIIKTSPFDISA